MEQLEQFGRRNRASTTAQRARPGTYSIVARDPETGELGVAVQSHWFSVGPVVPWARPGVGAVATQANALISYGPHLLELVAQGTTADLALRQLLDADSISSTRQVAAIDAQGQTAVHTGQQCIPFAGQAVGRQVCCQANIMANETVWDAMLAAFEGAKGPLAERMLVALQAGELAGGDQRGSQSAALLVVPATGEWWETTVSLRVEDHEYPLAEMRRLLRLNEAYMVASEADELAGLGRHAEASLLYRRACQLAPENHELLFWSGLGAVQGGDLEQGISQVRAAIAMHSGWADLLPRLTPQVSPAASVVAERLGLS